MSYKVTWAEDSSKLNKTELLKLEKDGLDIIDDIIHRYAKTGFEGIPKEQLDLFKWAGIYQDKPKDGHFMLRVRIPSGLLNSGQARVLADISKDFGTKQVDVTTRQAVQFHGLTVESFPEVFKRLEEVGLFSYEACGDCPRTILGNPLAGIDPDELIDTTPIVKELQDFFLLNRDFSNLPRKFKISISANPYNVGFAEINDLAFTPAIKETEGEEVIGFHVWVGGGLSAKPHLAQQLDIFVKPEEVLKVSIGVATIFRDYGYRQHRHHARLKFLVADWGVEKFRSELVNLIGPLLTRGVDKTLGWRAGNFTGVHPQKQPGLNYIGLIIPVGRLSAEELLELARLAETYGDGSIRTCNSQNIIIPNIPTGKVEQFLKENVLERLTPYPNPFIENLVSCTGSEFCNLAQVQTKGRMQEFANYLNEKIELDVPIRINVVGCTNSCGQVHIADIGLLGCRVKTESGTEEAFDILVGGTLGSKATFTKVLKKRVKVDILAEVILNLLTYFKENREGSESFSGFVNRVGIDTLKEMI